MRTVLASLALLLVAALPATARGQTPAAGPGVIHGVVVSAAGEPLAGASVAVRRAADSTVVGGKITGRDGRFRVEGVPEGRYLVQVGLLGHTPQRREATVAAGAATVDLGTVRLGVAVTTLQGVEVRGERAPMALLPDRTVYATRDMPVAAGGTATDALRTVPELEVDVNGKVTTRGATPKIHINGRPAPMQGEALDNYLQNLPANKIDRIEVVPNPGAKYEAEGLGGIVNIVMKEGVSLGLSGNLSLNTGTRGRNGASGRLNYQEGRVTLFGGASMNLYGNDYTNDDLRVNRLTSPVTMLRQASRNSNDGTFGSVDLTTELKLSRRSTVWAEGRASRSGSDNSGLTKFTHLDAAELPTLRYDRASESSYSYTSAAGLVGFRHVVQPQRHELSLEVRRTAGGNENESESAKWARALTGDPSDLPPELTVNDRDDSDSDLSLQADYMRPLGKRGKVEVGYRGSFRDTDNDQLMEVFPTADAPAPIHSTAHAFHFRERFHSGYLTFDQKVGKLGVQLGVRAERADTDFELPLRDESFANDYGSLFPSANLSYELGEGKQVRLSYSKRLQRPYVFFLNPINPSVDPLNRYVGNPYLKPQYTHSYSLETSWTGGLGSLRLSPYYRRTVDQWDQIKRVDSLGVSTVTWENLASIRTLGASLNASLRQRGPFSGFVGVSGFRETRDASNVSLEYSGTSYRWSTNANLSAKLSPTLNVQGQASFWPARDVPQGRISSSIYSSIGARQQLWGNKASLNLSVMDPFDLYRSTFTTSDRTHQQTGRSNWSMRQASLSFTYNFGRPPQSERRRGGMEEGQPQESGASGIR